MMKELVRLIKNTFIQLGAPKDCADYWRYAGTTVIYDLGAVSSQKETKALCLLGTLIACHCPSIKVYMGVSGSVIRFHCVTNFKEGLAELKKALEE